MSSTEEFQETLFKDAATLPSTACRRRCVLLWQFLPRLAAALHALRQRSPWPARRRYLDAMLSARDMKSKASPLAQRMEEADRVSARGARARAGEGRDALPPRQAGAHPACCAAPRPPP